MIIQYYCYYLPTGIHVYGWTTDHYILDIGFGITECEWMIPNT